MHARQGEIPHITGVLQHSLDRRLFDLSRVHPKWKKVIDLYIKAIKRNVPPMREGSIGWTYDPPFGYLKAFIKGTPGVPVMMDAEGFRSDLVSRDTSTK